MRAPKVSTLVGILGLFGIILASSFHARAGLAMPPVEPEGEAPYDHSDPGLVARCESEFKHIVLGMGARPLGTLVTKNKTWGVIWRGDYMDSKRRDAGVLRIVCTRSSTLVTPLEVHNPDHTARPLPAR
jgi:hypothetical protein